MPNGGTKKEFEQAANEQQFEDYDVYDQDGQYVGSIEMPENADSSNMPTELEINGVVYKPQF
jgi:hypothetical protein